MNHERFRVIAGVVAFCTAAASASVASAQSDIRITVNGSEVRTNPAPVNQDGRVFVPLRSVFERLGASVDYANGRIDANGNGRDITLQIGSTQAAVNGQSEVIDVAPFLIGDSTYVPLRFVSQALGDTVGWDDAQQTVSITTAYGQYQSPSGYANDANNFNENGVSDQFGTYDSYVSEAPPPLPDYEQPPVPQPDYLWQPGFWDFGQGGYFWVPGTWVQAPQPNLVWTPGFWGFHDGYFGFHHGYWAPQVGYYGGINYGAGYDGNGYNGGRWRDGVFQYNTAVTHVVDRTIIRNVYIDNTVVRNTTIYNTTIVNRTSYVGGPHGVQASPTERQLEIAKGPHVGLTAIQTQHIVQASQDRRFLESVNGGRPAMVVAPHPFTPEARPEGSVPLADDDKIQARKLVVPPVAPRFVPNRELARPIVAPRAILRPTPIPFHPALVAPRPIVRPRPLVNTVRPEAVTPPVMTPRVAHPYVAHPYVAPQPMRRPLAEPHVERTMTPGAHAIVHPFVRRPKVEPTRGPAVPGM